MECYCGIYKCAFCILYNENWRGIFPSKSAPLLHWNTNKNHCDCSHHRVAYQHTCNRSSQNKTIQLLVEYLMSMPKPWLKIGWVLELEKSREKCNFGQLAPTLSPLWSNDFRCVCSNSQQQLVCQRNACNFYDQPQTCWNNRHSSCN